MAFEDAGDARGAALRWEKVLEVDPEWIEGWCRLGEAQAAQGRMEEAHRAWRQGAFHPRCAEAQGRAYLETHPQWALQRFETLARLSSEDPQVDLLLARALARIDAERGWQALERYLSRVEEPTPEVVEAGSEVAANLEGERAIEVLRALAARLPEHRGAFEPALLDLEVDLRAEELMGARALELSAEQREQLEAARRRVADGRLVAAHLLLDDLVDDVARNPEVWAALADVREATGDIGGAEQALGIARQLDPLSAELHARYAEVLGHYGGRFGKERLSALEKALDLVESQPIRRRHAELAERLGETDAAIQSWSVLEGQGVADAKGRLDDLRRQRPTPLVLPAVPPPQGVPPDAWMAVHRGRVFLERARQQDGSWSEPLLARARTAVDEALSRDPDLELALVSSAQLHHIAGDERAAIQAYRAVLASHPDRVDVRARLGALLADAGDPEGDRLLEEAAAAGEGTALVRLARRDAGAHRWWAALERLDAYGASHSSGPEYDGAMELRRELRQRLFLAGFAVLVLVLVVGGVPIGRAWRRRQGIGVQALLRRHPRVALEVARVLSALRHEVLKHNISALPMAADRLEDGDVDVVAWLDERLYGREGAVLRFRATVEELEDIGSRAGVRLNLRYRDPILGPAVRAFDELAAVRTLDRRAAPVLRTVAGTLNGPVYEGLGSLLQDVFVVRVDEALLDRVWSTVRAEVPESSVRMQTDGRLDTRVRMVPGDLVDVLVNLLRNARDASAAEGHVEVGVRVVLDEDPITGLVRTEIRVCDHVEKRLTTKMVRSRHIDRGLGLAVDLVSRAGGSVHVESEERWSKALVVRLPMVEG